MATPDPKQNDSPQLGIVIAVCATLIALVIVLYFFTRHDKNHFSHWTGVLGIVMPVLVVCKGACFSLGSFDLSEDLVGVLGPGERVRVVVP